MSKHQEIIDAVISRCQTILITNGYQTNIGRDVRDWETNYDATELPALSVCDLIAEDDVPQIDSTVQFTKIPIQLRIFSGRETDAKTLRKIIADIYRAIKQDSRWIVTKNGKTYGLAMHTFPAKKGINQNPDTFEVTGAIVEIEVFYKTNIFEV